MLAAKVAAGELPPVEDRLPVREDVLVIPVVERIGDYGGTWRRAFRGRGGQNADRLMMDHVLLFDLNGADVIPNVVKSWQVSADERTFTMQLRRGMQWNDGTPFTADAFTWVNANIVRNDKLNPNKEGRLGISTYGPRLRRIDDSTIEWSFDEPQPGFFDEMATFRYRRLDIQRPHRLPRVRTWPLARAVPRGLRRWSSSRRDDQGCRLRQLGVLLQDQDQRSFDPGCSDDLAVGNGAALHHRPVIVRAQPLLLRRRPRGQPASLHRSYRDASLRRQ